MQEDEVWERARQVCVTMMKKRMYDDIEESDAWA